MKKSFIIILLGLTPTVALCQQKDQEQAAIKKVINSFMGCLKTKDSTAFYQLFYNGPVTWVGVDKARTRLNRLEKDAGSKTLRAGSYKTFYRSISDQGVYEEKFDHIFISGDESVATVIFDYSFWENNQMTNWGKESWGLVKENGNWKISSIIFSVELNTVAQP